MCCLLRSLLLWLLSTLYLMLRTLAIFILHHYTDFTAAGVSPALIAKLGRNENVSTESLAKICTALHCDIGDIMEIVPAKGGESGDPQ